MLDILHALCCMHLSMHCQTTGIGSVGPLRTAMSRLGYDSSSGRFLCMQRLFSNDGLCHCGATSVTYAGAGGLQRS